jgi:hypothetical protein
LTKEWNARITETINFIRTAQVPAHPNMRVPIAELLDAKYRQNQIPQALSQQMSFGAFYALQNRDIIRNFRKYRRALILIRVAILGDNAAFTVNQVAAIQDQNLALRLDNALNAAYQHEQQWLQAEYLSLRTNPAHFLAAKKLQIIGTNASGIVNYTFFYNPDKRQYNFRPLPMILNFVHIVVQVYHVHVQQFATVQNNLGAIVGGNTAGADVMITTQLSGCSLMYETTGQGLVAAHIQPTGGQGAAGQGINLVATLRNQAGFNNGLVAGNFGVFGSEANVGQHGYVVGNRHAYIIGVRRNGVWELHAQQHAIMDAASIPTTWQVV